MLVLESLLDLPTGEWVKLSRQVLQSTRLLVSVLVRLLAWAVCDIERRLSGNQVNPSILELEPHIQDSA